MQAEPGAAGVERGGVQPGGQVCETGKRRTWGEKQDLCVLLRKSQGTARELGVSEGGRDKTCARSGVCFVGKSHAGSRARTRWVFRWGAWKEGIRSFFASSSSPPARSMNLTPHRTRQAPTFTAFLYSSSQATHHCSAHPITNTTQLQQLPVPSAPISRWVSQFRRTPTEAEPSSTSPVIHPGTYPFRTRCFTLTLDAPYT